MQRQPLVILTTDIKRLADRGSVKKKTGEINRCSRFSQHSFEDFMKIQISRKSISSTIGKERDLSLRFPSRGQPKSNQSRSKNLTDSTEHSYNTQRNGNTPLSDFLQSFRENGAHYISSAYL
jgi:hypothetical protein